MKCRWLSDGRCTNKESLEAEGYNPEELDALIRLGQNPTCYSSGPECLYFERQKCVYDSCGKCTSCEVFLETGSFECDVSYEAQEECKHYIPEECNSEEEHDAVHHPNHYCQGGIECIKAIEASMTPTGFQDYCKGNVVKYIWRWRDKAGIEDLKKARVYLDWLIESAEKEE
jgi:hypothetical protein